MKPALRLLLRQFTSPIVIILFAAVIVSMVVGDVTDGLIILAIIVPSGLLSFWQEHRAGQTMKALMRRVQVHVEVMRGGHEVTVPIEQLLVGDSVVLRIGDIVPGDLTLTESEGLQIDESALTGESFAAEKVAGDWAYLGSYVAAGSGVGVVKLLGNQTKYGALAEAIAGKDVVTGFERGMIAFGNLLMKAMLVLLAGLFLMNLVLQRPLLDSLLFSIALAVGLTPQLLPAIISVSLAAGAKRMAAQKVLVKRLDAIEDFGAMSVLCTDKTGTLTAGVIEMHSAIDASGAPSERVLRLAFLNASLQQGFANPLDKAVILSARIAVGPVDSAKLVDEIAYDFERKRLSVLVTGLGLGEGSSGEQILICKGAVESVLSVCKISTADRSAVEALFEQLSQSGNRVLAVATGKTLSETNLQFEGLLVFMDAPKKDASAVIAELSGLGVELILVTGDNRLAAKAIAGLVGVPNDLVLTGADIAAMTEQELAEKAMACRVFAEVEPLQKELIVLALQKANHTVGFFGDGINDSAAMHAADVGISVDTAVDVAKHAAAIVLLDKNLAVVAEGVRLGRKTFVNTLKYVRVTISANFGNMLSMALAAAFLPFLPLLPVQILLLNFLSDFPALAISGDAIDEEAVAKPRSWDLKSIRNFMVIFGAISSVFDIATFTILKVGFNADAELFRSGWFIESTLTELTAMLVLRTRRRFWKSRPGRALWIASVLVAITVIVFPFSGLGALLGLEPLPWPLLAALLGLIAVYAAMNEWAKARFMRD